MILLDTGVISEAMRPEPSPAVISWIRSLPEEQVFLPSLVVGELQKGGDRLPVGNRRSALDLWLEQLRQRFHNRILPFDETTALTWGRLSARLELKGQRMPAVDSLIAAFALRHEAVLATRNVEDFSHAGIDVVNPWIFSIDNG